MRATLYRLEQSNPVVHGQASEGEGLSDAGAPQLITLNNPHDRK